MEAMNKALRFLADLTSAATGKGTDSNHPANTLLTENSIEVSCFLRQSKQNSLRRKRMDEEPDLQPEERPGKRRRTETEVKQPSCTFAIRESKENPLKRRRMDVPSEKPDLQPEERPGKRRRTETEVKQPSCTFAIRESKENPLKRRRTDVPSEKPDLQPEERPGKRRRTDTEVKQPSCTFAIRESKENPLKRRRMDVPSEKPDLQPEERPGKRRRTDTEVNNVNSEKAEGNRKGSCPLFSRESKKNTLSRGSRGFVDFRHEQPKPEPEPEPEETPEKRRRTNTEEDDVKMDDGEETAPQPIRRNPFRDAKLRARYSVGKLLGEGGTAAVFAGIRKSDGRKVAIKTMTKLENEPYLTLPGYTCRLPLEVALMELVCKPPHSEYVIEMLDWFDTPTQVILILERPDPCIDLWDFCKSQCDKRLSEPQAKMIMEKVVSAASHCLKRGVFHRDIKEENIILNPETLDVKLIDFGCGDLLKNAPYTQPIGTEIYLPPELYEDEEYDAEPATVWSLGVLLYSLLCGRAPFNDCNEIVQSDINLPQHVPQLAGDLILKCLDQDPESRAELDEVITHEWFCEKSGQN